MTTYLFVCTGNICRSPMAEYLARSMVENAIGDFAGAGTMTVPGRRASDGALVAMAEVGIDLRPHRSRDLWSLDLSESVVYALHRDHLAEVQQRRPTVTASLLDPRGHSIPDPYGMDLDAYRLIRDVITEAIELRSAEWSA